MAQAVHDGKSLAARTREDLARRIREGEFRPGDRLPTEPDLAAAYKVSRVTLREALKGLEQEHLLRVVHGRGTFVVDTPITRPVTRLQSVTELVTELGFSLVTRVLEVRREPASDLVAGVLKLPAGTPLIRLERLRLERVREIEERPVIYSIDLFPAALVADERPVDAWAHSLFAYLEERAAIQITHSTATLRAVLLDARTSARINAWLGTPWLLMEQINFAGAERPILYSHDYHNGDLFSFDVLRRRH